MPPPLPDPALQRRAYELWCESRSLRDIQEILRKELSEVGRGEEAPRSHETVRRWIKTGELAVAWLRENADDEHHTSLAMARARFVTFLDNLMARGFDELDRTKAQYKDVAPIMHRLASDQARALGVYAPLRVHHEGLGSPAELDPNTLAVVDEMRQNNDQIEQAMLSGEES